MKCPQCGTWTEVLESVLRKDGSRRRRYQCANLHRFNTEERIVGLSSTLIKKEDVLSTLPRVNPRMPRLLMPEKP
jgi:transcriptional regulator NrdR family protein